MLIVLIFLLLAVVSVCLMSHNLPSPLRWVRTERQPQFFQLQNGDSVCSPGWLRCISSFPIGRNWRVKIWCTSRATGHLPTFHERPVRLPIVPAGPGAQEAAFMVHREDTARYNIACGTLFCSFTSLVALQNYFGTDYPQLSRGMVVLSSASMTCYFLVYG